MRKYISIYFQDGIRGIKKKRDFTIAFAENDPLYIKCAKFGSSKIKEIIKIYSYRELVTKAMINNRSASNYVKYKLTRALLKNGKKNLAS